MWRSDLIAAKFHKDDVDAILRIPRSHRQAVDAMIWLHTKKGVDLVKSGYHAGRQIKKNEDEAETSMGLFGVQVGQNYGSSKCLTKLRSSVGGHVKTFCLPVQTL